jgi:purine nucleosidase
MAARPLIIDCDPGVDDAIALMLAFAAPEFDILGITTVAGNVPLSLTSTNARRICELLNRRDMRVFAGCPRPILRSLITAEEVHGETGLTGIDLPKPTMPLQAEHGVNWLIQTLKQAPKPITIATLGPMTNIAMAIVQAPEIMANIQELALMGGAITHGNITPSAEFNLYIDPHAAQIVLTSGIPLTMISLDVTHTANATVDRLAKLQQAGRLGEIMAQLLNAYGEYDKNRHGFAGAPLHDPCVIAYLLQPELFESRASFVQIETNEGLGLGRTIVDWYSVLGQSPNVNVVTQIDADGFYHLLTERIASLRSTTL